MNELSMKSKAVVERYFQHRSRCLRINERFGTERAFEFHKKYKHDPCGEEALKEFKDLIVLN